MISNNNLWLKSLFLLITFSTPSVVLSETSVKAKVVNIEEIKISTELVCSKNNDQIPGDKLSRPYQRKTISVRGMFRGTASDDIQASLCVETGGNITAGYGVTYSYKGKLNFVTLYSRPLSFLKIDPKSDQIIAGLEDEPTPSFRSPPLFLECSRHYDNNDDIKARKVCGWLAEHGHAKAQNKYANLLFDGRGGRKHVKEALKWDVLGAQQGNGRSMNNLGWMYENGQGVRRDLKRAVFWYAKSADVGDVCGQNSLGHMYADGLGLSKDTKLAAEYFRKAAFVRYTDAKNCVANAKLNLGILTERGDGVRKSVAKAADFYRQASLLGNKKANERLSKIRGESDLFDSDDYFDASPSLIYTTPQNEGSFHPVKAEDVTSDQDPGLGLSLAKKLPMSGEKRNGIAIVISNQKYDHRDINPVSYAGNDRALIKLYAEKTLGFDDVRPIENMTHAEMLSLFGDKEQLGTLAEAVKSASEVNGKPDVFIYYSGHGAPSLKNKGSYLVARDTNPNQIELTGYPLSTLFNNLIKLNAKSVTLMTEACFSGASAGGTLVPKSSALVIRPRQISNLPSNFVNIAASKSDQVASWDEKSKLGLMTRYFVEGVIGSADLNKDGLIKSEEMQKYLNLNVSREASKRFQRIQNPVITGSNSVVFSNL